MNIYFEYLVLLESSEDQEEEHAKTSSDSGGESLEEEFVGDETDTE